MSSFPPAPDHGRTRNRSRIVGGFIAAVLIVAASAAGWYFSQQGDQPLSGEAHFSLIPMAADTAGVEPGTAFELFADQELTEKQVAEIVRFDPPVEFTTKRVASDSIIPRALAKGPGSGSGYILQPKEKLKEGKVYKAAITDPSVADREYSWAFQVKAPFGVLKTIPGDKSNYAPTNTGIEITFNREGLIDPQSHVSISPKVEGRYELHGDTLVFVPKGLQPKTVYTVTVAAGIRAEGSEDVMAETYTFRFETAQAENEQQSAYFGFQGSLFEILPNNKPVLSVSSYGIDTTKVASSVYKFESVDAFIDDYRGSRDWSLGWSNFSRTATATKGQPVKSAKVADFTGGLTTYGYQSLLEVPQVLQPGYYRVNATADGHTSETWFQVSPLARHYSYTNGRGLAWVYDFVKKTPVQSATVSFLPEKKEAARSKLGETDAQGLASFTTPEDLRSTNYGYGSPRFLLIEKAGYQPLVADVQLPWGGMGYDNGYWSYLSTDRFTYQMTDTARFWGVVKGRETDVRNQKVVVGLYHEYFGFSENGMVPQDIEPILQTETVISPFNTIEGEAKFAGLAPGTYSLVTSLSGKIITSSTIEVLTYTKPAYSITVTPSVGAMFAGTPVTFAVKAAFFEGTPVPNLKLRYSGYWRNQIGGELQLDARGEGSFTFTPTYEDGINEYYPRQMEVTFSPVNSEEGYISGSGAVAVFGPHLLSQVFQEGSDGDTYSFTAKLNTIVIDPALFGNSGAVRGEYIGDPLPDHDIEANVVRITHLKQESGDYYDPIAKTVQKTYSYTMQEKVVETIKGKTDGKGEWKFSKKLPGETDISYRVDVVGRDDGGRSSRSQAYAYYAFNPQSGGAGSSLTINGENYRKEFSPGEKMTLQMTRQDGVTGTGSMLVYRAQNDIDMAKVVKGSRYEEDFSEKFLPSVQYRAIILGPLGFEETNFVTAAVRQQDRKLDVAISPSKEAYKPGEKVPLDIKVTDKSGNGVAAEVNVAAVDEAVFHVLPYNWQMEILETVMRDIFVYPVSSSTQYLNQGNGGKPGGGAEGGGCFLAGTEVAQMDGLSKNIEEIRVGDKIATFSAPDAPSLVEAVVQGVSSHDVDEYLIINRTLKVTAEHPLYVNERWTPAGAVRVGDMLLGIDGKPVTVVSVERKQASRTRVYNLVVNRVHTYFADGILAHNAEKGGSPRTNFIDTALFQSVRTGSDGKAALTFTAPDNVTSWRVTARAFDTKGIQAGQQVKLVATTLPFFADVTVSDLYLTGDSPVVRVRSFGTQAREKEKTTFTLRIKETGWTKSVSAAAAASFPLDALKAGTYTLEVSASQGEYKDALRRTMRVVDSLFTQRKNVTLDVTPSLTPAQLTGSGSGVMQLTFMDGSRGKYYGPLSSLASPYFPRTRVDTLVSEYVAGSLLKQHFGAEAEPDRPDLGAYHEITKGGIQLLPYGGLDLTLSALVADAAGDAVYREGLEQYFTNVLTDDQQDINRTAQALYGLSTLGKPVLTKLQTLSRTDLTPADFIFVALGREQLGDREGARELYQSSIKPHLRTQGSWTWMEDVDETKEVKLTALTALLASRLGETKDAEALWEYLQNHSPKRDLDVLERALFLRSELERPGRTSVQFTYQTKDRRKSVTLENGATETLELLQDELATITFSDVQGSVKVASSRDVPVVPASLVKTPDLVLERNYLVNGKLTTTFHEGDIIHVVLRPILSPTALDSDYQIVDHLPQGLRPILRPFQYEYGSDCDPVVTPERTVGNTLSFGIWHGFFSDQYCAQRMLNYYARVVSKGRFGAHPALLQSQVDDTYLTLSPQVSVEVK